MSAASIVLKLRSMGYELTEYGWKKEKEAVNDLVMNDEHEDDDDQEEPDRFEVALEILCSLIRHHGASSNRHSQVDTAWDFAEIMIRKMEDQQK